MPDPHLPPSLSRKLGGIPQGDATSPNIYRKAPSFKMHVIPRPPEKGTSSAAPARALNYLGFFAVILLLGGGAAYLYFKTPPQLTALLQPQKQTPAPVVVPG